MCISTGNRNNNAVQISCTSELTHASTADSRALRRSLIPGSGSPRWAHSSSVWVVARHSSHLLVVAATPVKHIAYRVVLTTDHFVFPVHVGHASHSLVP